VDAAFIAALVKLFFSPFVDIFLVHSGGRDEAGTRSVGVPCRESNPCKCHQEGREPQADRLALCDDDVSALEGFLKGGVVVRVVDDGDVVGLAHVRIIVVVRVVEVVAETAVETAASGFDVVAATGGAGHISVVVRSGVLQLVDCRLVSFHHGWKLHFDR